MSNYTDLIIVGGGPAGLAAAINGASEGLSVRVLDSGHELGGQAKESSAIENYPGFPDGITGPQLMYNLVRQARKFKTYLVCPVVAQSLEQCPKSKNFLVTTDDYHTYEAKSVLIASGLQYRRLEAPGLADVMGRGVHYGMPTAYIPDNRACCATIVGGANSAGQAVLRLSKNKKMKIRLVIRKRITDQMSTYLIDRIREMDNVEVLEGCEVIEAANVKGKITGVEIFSGADQVSLPFPTDFLFIFIGAVPKTVWLRNSLELDEKKFIKTADGFETSMKGVFAVGDIRANSVKRISAASGEGSSVMPYIHRYLAA